MITTNHARFRPLIEAILNPELETIDGLDELTTGELVTYIKEYMPYDITLAIAMENPNQKGVYGYILNPRAFGLSKSKERLVGVLSALTDKFAEARKNIIDWEMYVGKMRDNSE